MGLPALLISALFISAVFTYVAVQIIKIGVAFAKYSEKETRINTLLNGTLIKSAGERVTVIKFFGPNRTMPYIPYSFMSCLYEAAKPGKQPADQIISQIPISLYIKFLKNFMDDSIVINPQRPDYAVSEAGYDLVAAQGETGGLYIMLKNIRLKPIGYLSLYKNDPFTDDDKRTLSDLAASLIPLIEGWDDKKAKAGIIYHMFPKKTEFSKREHARSATAAAYTPGITDYKAAADLMPSDSPSDSPSDQAADAWARMKKYEFSAGAPAPQNPVTREELADIIYKFFQLVTRL
jgi:hypothetical protein